MKKYLIIGAAALSLSGVFSSCSKDTDMYDPMADSERFLQTYAETFYRVFGQPSANQTWGFGDAAAASRVTRSASSPECPDIAAPYDETWVANYLTTAKEPTQANTWDNYDNKYYTEGTPGTTTYKWNWDVMNAAGYDAWGSVFNKYSWGDYTNASEQIYNDLKADGKENWIVVETTEGTEGYWTYDDTYVTNFKITGTWDGYINVAASEGITDGGTLTGAERTIVVTGTWNITDNQSIGSLGKIIIANGGTVNVAEGKTLNMVNQAQLVVLAGGKLTGAGKVEVNNGNEAGRENYNAGTIDVAVFNNNFGKFYNYGKFLVNEYQAGAVESNIYNHALVAIDHTNSVANARVFNACQFYVKNDARLRNYEGVSGSALIVGGQFMPFGSEDGTTIPSFVSLAAGALVKCGSLYNGSSWVGPTSGGYAALEIVNQIDYLNWVQDSPQTAGYFANNIYVKCGTWTNDPAGQGKHEDVDDGSEWGHINYTESRAEYKFWSVAANCTGNGNVTKVTDGSKEVFPADDDFVLGQAGCTPGFFIDGDPVIIPDEPVVKNVRIMAEDVSASDGSDLDFNDVVFDVEATYPVGTEAVSQVKVKVWAAGGTLPLRINSINGTGGFEVHAALGINEVKTMVNTHAKNYAGTFEGVTYYWQDNVPAYETTITLANSATISKDNFLDDVNNNLRVEVQKEGVWVLLTAERGKAACKIAVPVGTPWSVEKHNVSKAFPDFISWVATATPATWYTNWDDTYTYNDGKSVICAHGCE